MAAYMEEAESISDIFMMKVGNIPPGKEVKITFGYVTELKLQARCSSPLLGTWSLHTTRK